MSGNLLLRRGGRGAVIATFLGLTDTPGAYEAGKFVKVNATPDALILATIAWGDVSKVGSNLTDLVTREHGGLSDAPADAHHPQAHSLGSHSTKAHGELSDAPDDSHHAKLHAASHANAQPDELSHDALKDYVGAEHLALPNSMASVINSGHDKALHDALGIDHGSLGGRGDDDHTIYYNSTRHTKAVHDALLITTLGSGALAKDHGTPATDMLVNVCYGTGSPPSAGSTTIGTIWLKYT